MNSIDEALNVAEQCRATASDPLSSRLLVDEGNGNMSELLTDAARVIEGFCAQALRTLNHE